MSRAGSKPPLSTPSAPVVFVFPLPENLTNPKRRGSWRAAYGTKQRYLAACDLLQKLNALPAPPVRPWTAVQVSSVMELGNAMDDDNAMARHKWALDWLKTRGYIADDRKKNIRWASFPAQRITRRRLTNNPRTITLTLTTDPRLEPTPEP